MCWRGNTISESSTFIVIEKRRNGRGEESVGEQKVNA